MLCYTLSAGIHCALYSCPNWFSGCAVFFCVRTRRAVVRSLLQYGLLLSAHCHIVWSSVLLLYCGLFPLMLRLGALGLLRCAAACCLSVRETGVDSVLVCKGSKI
jgi:cytochrome c oxidase subunit IV